MHRPPRSGSRLDGSDPQLASSATVRLWPFGHEPPLSSMAAIRHRPHWTRSASGRHRPLACQPRPPLALPAAICHWPRWPRFASGLDGHDLLMTLSTAVRLCPHWPRTTSGLKPLSATGLADRNIPLASSAVVRHLPHRPQSDACLIGHGKLLVALATKHLCPRLPLSATLVVRNPPLASSPMIRLWPHWSRPTNGLDHAKTQHSTGCRLRC
jgi:hypothetical protein